MTASNAAEKSANALSEGADAPHFDMAVTGGGRASLSSLKGKNVVLYFYPKDDTPGCTVEAKDFRDLMKDFETANTAVIGVSRDDLKSHDKFREKFCLPFPLAFDEDGKATEDYGVWVEKSMYGKNTWVSNAPRSSSTSKASWPAHGTR